MFAFYLLERQIYDLSVGSILLYRLDALLHCRSAGIHFAGADYLAVGSLQVEVRLAVLSDIALETLVHGTVLLYGVDAFKARLL